MNTPSTAQPLEDSPQPRVWDAPVRVLHWLSALSFAGAWLTAEADGLRVVHITLGLSLAGLMTLRLLWGLVGSRTARFSSFLKGPGAVAAHLGELVQGRVFAHAGHNPAGGWAVLGLLGLSLATAATGWLTWTVGERFEDLHEGLATAALALVMLHLVAVALTSVLGRRNLVAAMVHGRAPVPPGESIARNHGLLAAAVFAALLAFWTWGLGPQSPLRAEGAGESRHEEHGHHGDDHDAAARLEPKGQAARTLRHDDEDD